MAVDQAHFKLLRQFGQSDLQKTSTDDERERRWMMSCDQARLPRVPLANVKKEWVAFVSGSSRYAGLAVNGDIDPRWVSIGILYNGHLFAAHTVKSRVLLKKLLGIHARNFKDREAFLTSVLDLCPSDLGPAKDKKK